MSRALLPPSAPGPPGTAGSSIPAGPPRPTWRDHWLNWRDRLLSDERFRRRASAFAPTRWIARRRAAQLFDLTAGFVYSQVLLACVRLGLFDLLASGPLDNASLARDLGLSPDNCERLLAAAAALRLVQRRRSGAWGLGSLGAVMVGNEAIAALVQHHAPLYADLADPLALLRGERGAHGGPGLEAYWPYARAANPADLGAGQVASYSALMAASQPLVAEQVLDAVDLARFESLLDVGGGEGAFVEAAARRAVRPRLAVFDLPAVAERARGRLGACGLASRVSVHGGDFLRDALPAGSDVITLVRVLHDHDDDHAMRLLRAVRAALPAGGALLVAEPMAGTPGVERMGDAYFGLYLLAMGSGRPRTAQRIRQMLADAGFGSVREHATRQPLQVRVLEGRALAGRTGRAV